MKTLILLSLLIPGAAFYSGCSNSPTGSGNEDDCGTETLKEKLYTQSSILTSLPDNYMADSLRVFNLWIPVDSICTKKHINSSFSASMNNDPARPFYFKAAIEWLVLFSRSSNGNLSFSGNVVSWGATVDNVGLAQSFGEGPGDVFINIYISFRSLGNAQLDSAYFVSNFRHAKMVLYYSFYKPSSSDDLNSSAVRNERLKLVPGMDRKTFYPGFFNQGEVYREEINNQTKKPSL